MGGASPASFLSPGIGGGVGGAPGSGRVTFADDSTGILGGGGLRRRRGGVGEKENTAGIGNNPMATMPIGFRKAPPKASLLSLSPMGGGGALGSNKTSSNDAAKVSSLLVDVDVIYTCYCVNFCVSCNVYLSGLRLSNVL